MTNSWRVGGHILCRKRGAAKTFLGESFAVGSLPIRLVQKLISPLLIQRSCAEVIPPDETLLKCPPY